MAKYKATWPSGFVIVWRDLTWEEFDRTCGGVDPYDIPPEVALEVYKACVLEGPDLRMLTAGISYWIARHQVENNPFTGSANSLIYALNTSRGAVQNDYLLGAQAVVAHVFDYKIEEIKTWTATKFFLRLAQAEIVVGSQINPAVPESPKENSPIPPPTQQRPREGKRR